MKAKNEGVMWAALAVCLVAGLTAPFFGDDGRATVIPFVVALLIAINIGWLRSKAGRDDRQQ
ncbi:hypothetical protein QWM81_26155 [Streptomyces ficellus]|uniref:Uncharacterized protein n=1 Tax=Streptomyces ficellus TaxID=1977088 RepID=A0ABT7ZDD5_9ACTN|nr:hypothetical protein [Streptomyces ficellus]MDN3297458.1 hypothetical protein [Streptomyces ficellus]